MPGEYLLFSQLLLLLSVFTMAILEVQNNRKYLEYGCCENILLLFMMGMVPNKHIDLFQKISLTPISFWIEPHQPSPSQGGFTPISLKILASEILLSLEILWG